MGRGGAAYTSLHVLQGEAITNKSRGRAKPGHGAYTQALRAWQVQPTLPQLQENVHNHSEHALGQFLALTFLLSRGVLPETAGGGKRLNQSLTNTPTNRTQQLCVHVLLTQYSTETLCLECGCVQL